MQEISRPPGETVFRYTIVKASDLGCLAYATCFDPGDESSDDEEAAPLIQEVSGSGH